VSSLGDSVAAAGWWPQDTRARRRLAIVLAVALGLRVAWALYAAREPTAFSDPLGYLYYGRQLAAGHGYRSVITHEPTAFYPIGFPLFVAGVAWVVAHTPLPDDLPNAVAVVHALLSTATVLLTWIVARRLFGGRVALVAAALMALWPGLILLVATAHLETVFVFLVMAALAVLLGRRDEGPPSFRRVLVAGALLGLSALVRPFSLLFLPALFIGWGAGGRGWARAAVWTLWAALPVVVVLTPWVVRNQRELGTPVLSTNMGDTLCLDHRQGAIGRFTFPRSCFEGYEGVPPAEIEQERNREGIRRALRFVADHPGRELELIGLRARYMVEGDHDGLTMVESNGDDPFLPDWLRSALRVVADSWYWVTLALAVPGMVAFARRAGPHRDERLVVLLAGLSLFVVTLELYGYTRFHVPVLPFQAIAAAVTSVVLFDWVSTRRAGAPR
jgi:hypothetical protein